MHQTPRQVIDENGTHKKSLSRLTHQFSMEKVPCTMNARRTVLMVRGHQTGIQNTLSEN